jgi:hypothetical protein
MDIAPASSVSLGTFAKDLQFEPVPLAFSPYSSERTLFTLGYAELLNNFGRKG